ncbi:DUF47 domain-containing protein [Parasporobacterium paucivorans]|uniref:TIGR00153 family protein n=1 Tax=Parasporobacterium paucivorans DSM 15970 TaxID=1122934 RepID=A0A1M6EVG4_9FIRM|nr:DUF47 family protein [Parasporobacterium paucivorans]SHI89445.1 hypothetical protein SAMN02745691_01015 [Parasporobacterium paucivorans DSM 15970]
MKNKKNYNYFDGFIELVDSSCRCAKFLQETIVDFDESKIEDRIKEIHSIEHEADLKKHDMITALTKEFLPPIEREDIVNLSQEIDNITDAIEDVLIKLHMFNVKELKPDVIDFVNLIIKCCDALKIAIEEFPRYKKSLILKDKIIEVNHLEEDGDKLYYSTVRNMFKTIKDPIELMVWTDIYDYLEKCFDCCENAADILESIVMKNS